MSDTDEEVLGPDVSDGEADDLAETVDTVIENGEGVLEDARRAAEEKRHEMVDSTGENADLREWVEEINQAVRRKVEATLHEAVMDAEATPDKLEGHAYDVADEVIAEHADMVLTDWAISRHELAVRIDNRPSPDVDPDAAYERRKEKELSDKL